MTTPDLAPAVSCLPPVLQAEVRKTLADLSDTAPIQLGRLVAEQGARRVTRLLACSPFVARYCGNPHAFDRLLNIDLSAERSRDDYSRLATMASTVTTEAELAQHLRQVRNLELVRIAWRDLADTATAQATMHELSLLADSCLSGALRWHSDDLGRQYGLPQNACGRSLDLVVIGMGKLGAYELNFSSDIDLIFTYPSDGQTQGGARSISNEEFFSRLGQRIINTLSKVTSDGFVYRVDMRLRPFGDSGPLATSFDALEFYYTTHARDWERYAMVKARVVVGGDADREHLESLWRPFVYRRYLDYGAFESIRDMKAMIDIEVKRRGVSDNVKLGAGGIREIEFIVQTFQLLRGGRQSQLRNSSLLQVLEQLGALGHLDTIVAEKLKQAYLFLRTTEHRLQEMRDEQTHQLPASTVDQARLALGMNCDSYATFRAVLDGHRCFVHSQFEALLERRQPVPQSAMEQTVPAKPWPGIEQREQSIIWLYDCGHGRAEEIFDHVQKLVTSHRLRHLTRKGKERFDRLLPNLLKALIFSTEPVLALERIVPILESIGQRSVYLALLSESSDALKQLIRLAAASPWIASYIARHPILLDELIDPRVLYAPLDPATLDDKLNASLAQYAPGDLEREMEVLRHFKHSHVLRVAAADIGGLLEVRLVSDLLTAIAESVTRAAMTIAERDLGARHGFPSDVVDGQTKRVGFAIIAYGKLGGYELGYGSDLDLVFLQNAKGLDGVTDGGRPLDNQVFFTRLAQRIIHVLGTVTPAGQAYDIDIRLRPSGRSGLLVTDTVAFLSYQEQLAWTWEHQALTRARAIGGDPEVVTRFREIRARILRRERNPAQLQKDVMEMRGRMHKELCNPSAGSFDLKQGRGGITDIEFMMQYHVLLYAYREPRLLEYTANREILGVLASTGLMAASECEALLSAYLVLRGRIHQLALQAQPAIVPDSEFKLERGCVIATWLRVFGKHYGEETPV